MLLTTTILVFNTINAVVCNDNQYEAGLLDSRPSKMQTEIVEIQASIRGVNDEVINISYDNRVEQRSMGLLRCTGIIPHVQAEVRIHFHGVREKLYSAMT